MKFSLVLATVHRTVELERFLACLDGQTYRDFELIVVDQNPDGRLIQVLEPYMDRFSLIHIRSSERGLSRARNLGIQYVNGDIVAFPDDDCWYPRELLHEVQCFFIENPQWYGISGRAVDVEGTTSLGNFDLCSGPITRLNIWRRINSNTVFLCRELVEATGQFDESLGVGAGTPWGSAEEIDYVLRVLQMNYSLFYDPDLKVGHPNPVSSYDEAAFQRACLYGSGMGRVLRTYKYPIWFVLYYFLRPLGGVLLALIIGNWPRIQYHRNIFRGRVYGWWSNKPR